ncbi:hypothetical protein IID04_05415 [PVC group bacterium]|nr:hypothetical protein [PVC group bacterium]
MNRLQKCLSGLCFGVVLVTASDAYALELSEQTMDVTVSNAYVSQYLWRGYDLHTDNMGYQPSIDLTFPELFYGIDLSLNWWASFPLSKGNETAKEIDYSVTLSRDIIDQINLSAGWIYYDFFVQDSGIADVHEFWGSLTWTLPLDISTTISTTGTAYYDFPHEESGPENGWFFAWSIDLDTPLPDWVVFQEEQTISYGVVIWSTDGVAGTDPAYFYSYDLYAATSYTVGEYVTINPSVHYVLINETSINTEDDEFWTGVTLDVAF